MIEMNQPSGPNPLDENRQQLIGAPLDRVDGRLKVTGQATYAHEFFDDRMAYGYIVEATIATGVIDSIDVAAAEHAPGVLLVMTYRNAPAQGRPARRESTRSSRGDHSWCRWMSAFGSEAITESIAISASGSSGGWFVMPLC